MITLSIPGTPLPQRRGGISTRYPKRKDGSGGGPRPFPRVFPHTKTEKEQGRLRTYAEVAMAQANHDPIRGPVGLLVLLSFLMPKSWTRRERDAAQWMISPPDRTNVSKLVEDSLNGVCWTDDRQIVYAVDMKLWSPTTEGYEIRVYDLSALEDRRKLDDDHKAAVGVLFNAAGLF
jgi:Holliday junction resolvase RusA-like endonuclease